MAYQLNPSAIASVKLCAASVSSARLLPIIPAIASMKTNSKVSASESARREVVCLAISPKCVCECVCMKLSMIHMLKPQAIQFRHVVIIERIINLPSIFTAAQKPHLAQSSQLMRNRRLGHRELSGDLSHVHFTLE